MYVEDTKADDRTILRGVLAVPRGDVQALPTGRRDIALERLRNLSRSRRSAR